MSIKFTVVDDDDEREELVAEIVDAEARKFTAQICDVLEQRGVTDVRIRIDDD